MGQADQHKWDERYRAGAYSDREYPCALLAEWLPKLSPGRALDLACGAGRNSLFMAANRWQVDAIDISPAGLERARRSAGMKNLEVNWLQADLDDDSASVLPPGTYELILQVRYVNIELYSRAVQKLAAGGMLLSEQHVDSKADVIGPRNKAYRMRHNELLRAYSQMADRDSSLRLLYYKEGTVTDPDGRNAALAQLVVRRESVSPD